MAVIKGLGVGFAFCLVLGVLLVIGRVSFTSIPLIGPFFQVIFLVLASPAAEEFCRVYFLTRFPKSFAYSGIPIAFGVWIFERSAATFSLWKELGGDQFTISNMLQILSLPALGLHCLLMFVAYRRLVVAGDRMTDRSFVTSNRKWRDTFGPLVVTHFLFNTIAEGVNIATDNNAVIVYGFLSGYLFIVWRMFISSTYMHTINVSQVNQ